MKDIRICEQLLNKDFLSSLLYLLSPVPKSSLLVYVLVLSDTPSLFRGVGLFIILRSFSFILLLPLPHAHKFMANLFFIAFFFSK